MGFNSGFKGLTSGREFRWVFRWCSYRACCYAVANFQKHCTGARLDYKLSGKAHVKLDSIIEVRKNLFLKMDTEI